MEQSVKCLAEPAGRRLADARVLAEDPADQPRKGKSRVTNGKSLFVEFDGRGPWTRRWRDLLDQILADLVCKEGLSEGQRQLARRAATLSIVCEKLEGEAAAGNDFDLDLYGQLTDRLGRCLQRLGIQRSSEPAEDMDSYLASRKRIAPPPAPDRELVVK